MGNNVYFNLYRNLPLLRAHGHALEKSSRKTIRVLTFLLLVLFPFIILSQSKDTTFKCYRLELVDKISHEKEEFEVYVFKRKNQKEIGNMQYVIVFIDSLQMSPISYLKDIKIKDLIIGHMYNICLKKLYYYDHTKDIHKRSLGYRGMGIYGYKNGSGDVYITHDIQNGKILKRKRNDTIDYFKRKPLYLHGYGEFPG